ncbi:MAG: ATP-binding protein, partial [Vicinamibacterales bacterium]
MRRIRHHELGVLAAVVVVVLALGLIVARDLRRTMEDASQVHLSFARGLEFIDALQFNMQEIRRVLLYALSTSDANRQLEYAEQSRAIDTQVQRLFDDRDALSSQPNALRIVETVDLAWKRYLVVRNEVIGLTLEGSLPEAVALDEHEGLDRFNDVRRAIRDLKATFTSGADAQLQAARTRTTQATVRLTILVLSSLVGSAIGMYLVNRRASLEALLRSEAHKGSILQAVPDPIISTDAAGRVIEVNEAAQRTFGFSRQQALGAMVEDLMLRPGSPRELLTSLMSVNDETPESLMAAAPRFETIGARTDGSEFPMELAAVTHRVGADRVFTIHVSDMTERRQSEQELRHAKEVAESAARGQRDFLATMTHELRTPLSGVIGIADLLQQANLPASQRDLIAMLRTSATALMELVGDVLDYSRIEQGLMDLAPEDFNLRDCIEEALDTVAQPAAGKGLEIGSLFEPGVPAIIRTDKHRVRQVLLNLLSNAVKFTETGEVTVHVSAQREADDGVAVNIMVRDSGPGIPEHLHHKLFQRFSQTDAKLTGQHAGTGLGLAISKGLCELLNGSLDLNSREGEGATFRFVFRATMVTGATPDVYAGLRPGLNVLVFVGPGIVGEQVEALLTNWGVRCTMASSLTKATDRRPADQVHAMIVDGDADHGRLLALAHECQSAWGLDHARLLVLARPALAARHRGLEHDRVVGKPVSARRLHDALLWAVRAAEPESVDPNLPEHIAPFAPDSLAILLAEDNEANRRVLLLMLEELGLAADVVGDGIAAVERAAARDYDLILMDVRMPGLDGLEATRCIRANPSKHWPVIMALTANVMPGEEALCLDAGMDGYLSKPLRLDNLASLLQRLILRTRK